MTAISIKGVDAVVKALQAKASGVDRAVNIASKRVGAEVVGELKKSFKGTTKLKKTKSGRRYAPKLSNGRYTTANVGGPPNVATGNLRRSINYRQTRKGFGTYEIIAGPTAIYGRHVELGGPNWKRGINYPYVAPTAKMMTSNNKLGLIYSQAVEQGLRAI